MNKSGGTFDGFDHQYTPEEYLDQIYAGMICTMREQPLDLVAYHQWHEGKIAYKECFLSGITLRWF